VAQGLFQRGAVTDVAFNQCHRLAADFLNPPYRFGKAVAVVVEHDNLMSGLEQLHAGMCADITCAACY
jgi:hypothetical protein